MRKYIRTSDMKLVSRGMPKAVKLTSILANAQDMTMGRSYPDLQNTMPRDLVIPFGQKPSESQREGQGLIMGVFIAILHAERKTRNGFRD